MAFLGGDHNAFTRRLFWLLVAAGGLTLLWYKRVMIGLPAGDRLPFLAGCAAGFLAAGALIDEGTLSAKRPNDTYLIWSAALALAATAVSLVPSPAHVVALIVAGAAAGALFLQFLFNALRRLPSNRRGLAFAGVFMVAGAINTVTDLNSLPAFHVTGRTANGVMACVALGLVLVLLVTQGRAFNSRIVRVADHDLAGLGAAIRIGLLADLSFILLFASLALHESIAYPTAIEAVTPNEAIRFIELPFFLAAGLITDLVGRRPLLGVSLVAAFAGATASLAGDSQLVVTLATGGAYFAIIAFPVACVALLSDATLYARNPALLGALAFAPILVGELVAGWLGPVAARLAGDVVFVVTLGVLAVLTGLVTWLSSLLRRHLEPLSANVTLVPVDEAGAPEAVQVAVRFDFTPREAEILELTVEGLTVKQMAERLFLTEATVKFHITNMLRKTQSANRAALLAKLGR